MPRLCLPGLLGLLLTVCFQLALATPRLNVTINGVSPTLAAQLKQSLDITQYHDYATRSKEKLHVLYQRGIRNIDDALKPLGYYQARVTSQLTYEAKQDRWSITYTVRLGNKITIADTQFTLLGEGKHTPEFVALIQHTTLKPKHVFNLHAYQTLKSNLLNQANALGYFQARFITHAVIVNLKTNTVTIRLSFDTKKRYRYGTIRYKQTTFRFDDAFLATFNPIKTHAPYHLADIHQLETNLRQSGYFASINIKTRPIARSHTVNVTVHLQAEQSQQYLFGIGYGDQTKLRGTVGATFPHITRSGQSLKAFVQASKIYTHFYVDYLIPGNNPLTEHYSISAASARADITPYFVLSRGIGVASITQRGKVRTSIGLNAETMKVTPQGDNETSQHYLTPEFNISYANTARTGFYDHGTILNNSLTGGHKAVLSTASFIKDTVDITTSWHLTDDSRFFVNVLGGALYTPQLRALSPTIRFYAGGVGLVRGYNYKSQGPLDDHGHLIGGKYILSANANLEHRLYGHWSGLLYYDAGNAFNRLNAIHPVKGAGVGLSWRTLLGPLNFYLTKPLDHTHHWHFDFNVGVAF